MAGIIANVNPLAIHIAAVAYFAPAVIAVLRKHPRQSAIVTVNLLLGWTVIGWVWALSVAIFGVRPRPVARRPVHPPRPDRPGHKHGGSRSHLRLVNRSNGRH